MDDFGSEDNNMSFDVTSADKFVFIGSTQGGTIGATETNIGLVTFGNKDVFLPPVLDAIGRIYTIFITEDRAGVNDADIKIDGGDGGDIINFRVQDKAATFPMDDEGEYSILYSDGIRWYELKGVHYDP